MCLLILAPAGEVVEERSLVNAWATNPDGGGFAYIHRASGKIITRKSMDMNKFIDDYFRAAKSNPDTPFLVHLRFGTHGSCDLSNVHPFAMDEFTTIGHNGVINCLMTKGDGRSDTATFIQDYLRRLPHGWLDDPCMVDLVEDYTSGSKLVALTVDPYLSEEFYILNEDAGHWEDGIWYSNHSYVSMHTTSTENKYGGGWGSSRSYTAGGWTSPKKELVGSSLDSDDEMVVLAGGVKVWQGAGDDDAARAWDDDDTALDFGWYCIECGEDTDHGMCFECETCIPCGMIDNRSRSAWTCDDHELDRPTEDAYIMWLAGAEASGDDSIGAEVDEAAFLESLEQAEVSR